MLNGALFSLVISFLNPSVVLVIFASQFTDSTFLLGLAGIIRAVSWFLPQLWVSGYMQSQERAMPFYRYSALFRALCLFALVIAIFTVKDPNLMLAIFFALLVSEQLAGGIGGLSFLDVVGKVIPAAKRGVFFGWRQTIGGVLAIGGGAIVSVLLGAESPLQTPANFGVIFAMATGVSILAFLSWIMIIKEPPMAPRGPRRGGIEQMRQALAIWREDANYRVFLQSRIALLAVMITITPFVTVYASKSFAVPVKILATYPAVNAVARLTGTSIGGWISARWGNRRLIRLGAGLSMFSLLMIMAARPLALSTVAAGWYFMLVFVILTWRDSALQISLAALNINVAPVDRRPLYLGFANTVVGLSTLLCSTAGMLVDAVGFEMFFLLALLPTGFGVWRLRALRDPTEA